MEPVKRMTAKRRTKHRMKGRTKRSVLVVDDDRVTRHLVRSILAKAGFKVTVAKDGFEALQQLRTRRFNLMLLDVWMPRLTGLDLLDRVKGTRRPKVIVMTSDDAPQTLLKAVRRQAFEYVHKPLEPLALVSLVHEALARGPKPPPIKVISARPDWVELLVPCTRAAAERIQRVMDQIEADLPEDIRESVAYAFRELLLNAIEWGGKLNPKRQVRVAYVSTKKMLVYRIADPGPGFRTEDLTHAAITHPDDPIAHMSVREEKRLRPGGFGLLMVRAKVDELVYNEKQNEVMFVKYLK